MFTSVSRLNPNNPVDKAVLGLVQKELVTVHFDKESNQLIVTLTKKGKELRDTIVSNGFEPKPSQELTDKDEEQIEKFLNKVEKNS